MPLDIRIITAPGEVPRRRHVVMRLASCWEEAGHRVRVGPAREVEGDVALLHVDRTRVPEAAIPRNPAGVPLLNAGVLDISKRVVSRQLVRPGDAHRGPVTHPIFGAALRGLGQRQLARRCGHAAFRDNHRPIMERPGFLKQRYQHPFRHLTVDDLTGLHKLLQARLALDDDERPDARARQVDRRGRHLRLPAETA